MDPKDSAFSLIDFLAIFNTCPFLLWNTCFSWPPWPTVYLFFFFFFLSCPSWVTFCPQLWMPEFSRFIPWPFILPSFLPGLSYLIPQLYNPPYQLPIAAILLCNKLSWNSVSDSREYFQSEKIEALWEKLTSKRHKWHEPLNLITAFSTVLRELTKKPS